MLSLQPLYISGFLKFAQESLEKSASYKEIVPFANSLNEKANQLLLKASLNKSIDTQDLQKELFETGREFIRKFAIKFNQVKISGKLNESIKQFGPVFPSL